MVVIGWILKEQTFLHMAAIIFKFLFFVQKVLFRGYIILNFCFLYDISIVK